MTTTTDTRLKNLYKKAVSLKVTSTSQIIKKLGVTSMGACCLLYMIKKREYYPELEHVYTLNDASALNGMNEDEHILIKFNGEFPPLKHYIIYTYQLSETDKRIYVSLGLADKVSFNEFRLEFIDAYLYYYHSLSENYKYFGKFGKWF